MRTIRIKLYKFSELSKDAQQSAIENLYDINVNFHWWESVYEDAERAGLKLSGFEFDSASFVSNLTGEFTLSASEVTANIFRDHGESCETYKTATSFMDKWQPAFSNYIETEEGDSQLIDMEDEFLNDLISDYRDILQQEYEYQTSKEQIIEAIEANEYEFTKDGKLS